MANLFLYALLLSIAVVGLSLAPVFGAGHLFEGRGQLVFDYTSGTSPITSVVFHLPSGLTSAMTIDSTTNSFASTLQGDVLMLSGGSLSPGQSLLVQFHLTRFVQPAAQHFNDTAMDSSGAVIATSSGTMGVTLLVLLNIEAAALQILNFFTSYQIPILALGGIGVAASTAGLINGRKPLDPTATRAQVSRGVVVAAASTTTTQAPQSQNEQQKAKDREFEMPAEALVGEYGIDITQCPQGWKPALRNTVQFTARVYEKNLVVGWKASDAKRVFGKFTTGLTFSSIKVICVSRMVFMTLWNGRANALPYRPDG